MALTDGKRATIAGAVAGGALMVFFVYRKVGDLTNQATVMQASLQTRAQEMVEAEAEASVYSYLAQNFGVTPERIAGVERLINRVGL
jgi:uncharacterized membrane protein